MHPAIYKALRCQLFSVALLFLVGQSGILPPVDILALAALQGLAASFIALMTKSDRWWLPIHLVFMPAIVLAAQLRLPANTYALIFGIVLCVYWTSFRSRVPLFLSNRATVHRLAVALDGEPPFRVLDVGSGTGSFATTLARLRPDWQIKGCELAPAPYALSRWLSRRLPNVAFLRQDFWMLSLRNYDLVYAFLSPTPMEALWKKVRTEMPAGSLFVSNSFPVPGVEPERTIEVGDKRQTRLFCYRIPGSCRQ
jgi:SAM-dependent methyltransferase